MKGIGTRTVESVIFDFKGSAKDEKVAKISQTAVEMANTLNPGVNEEDIKELLRVVSEELTNDYWSQDRNA